MRLQRSVIVITGPWQSIKPVIHAGFRTFPALRNLPVFHPFANPLLALFASATPSN